MQLRGWGNSNFNNCVGVLYEKFCILAGGTPDPINEPHPAHQTSSKFSNESTRVIHGRVTRLVDGQFLFMTGLCHLFSNSVPFRFKLKGISTTPSMGDDDEHEAFHFGHTGSLFWADKLIIWGRQAV